MSFEIKDKIILVTGANRGIGKALTEFFLEHGAAKVYAAVRSIESASSLVEKWGDKITPIQVDLSHSESIVSAAKAASDVQMVVNNAGVLKTASLLDQDAVPSLEFEMKVNVYGLIQMAQAFAPVLKANGGGVFVQLNSVASLRASASFATYCASKAAAYSITQSLRDLLNEQGTTVLSVHPGPIATDMGDEAGLTDIAESPVLVAESIVEALKTGAFHAFPDSMAKQIGEAYQSFADEIIGANQINRES